MRPANYNSHIGLGLLRSIWYVSSGGVGASLGDFQATAGVSEMTAVSIASGVELLWVELLSLTLR